MDAAGRDLIETYKNTVKWHKRSVDSNTTEKFPPT